MASSDRGFVCMGEQKQREIAVKGNRSAQQGFSILETRRGK